MKKEKVNIEILKKLICDMVEDCNDSRFLRQIYSILMREKERTGT